MEKKYKSSWRIRKAYKTTIIVVVSYLWLLFKKRFLGAKYYERHIFALHVKNAHRVKVAILELEGLFIKVGQLLSILSNFLPEEFQRPLEELQDKVPPRPFSEVSFRVESELGNPPEKLFRSFDQLPLASASIGQAHKAILLDGTNIVVKVQHQNIEEIAKVDLEIIRKLTKLVGWFFEIKGLDFTYTQIKKMIEEELDFKQEAISMLLISNNLKEINGLQIPVVHPEFSTTRILTTTWHDGVKISNIDQIDKWNVPRQDIVAKLLQAYCKMVLKDGFYHADPHPGNILITQDGQIVLIDFGAVAHIGQKLQKGIPQLIEAAIKNDNEKVIETIRYMGFLADGQEATEMAEKMISALREFLQNEVKLESLNFKEIEFDPLNNSLLDLIQEIGLGGIAGTVQMPKDFVLLNRTLTLLLGISNSLAPELNPLHVVRPYVKEYVLGESDDFVGMATNFMKRSLSTAVGLPDELHRALKLIERGKLITRTPDIKDGFRLMYQVGQQFLLAILIVAAATFGYLFIQNGQKDYANYSFGVAGFLLLLLFRSMRKGSRIKSRLNGR